MRTEEAEAELAAGGVSAGPWPPQEWSVGLKCDAKDTHSVWYTLIQIPCSGSQMCSSLSQGPDGRCALVIPFVGTPPRLSRWAMLMAMLTR